MDGAVERILQVTTGFSTQQKLQLIQRLAASIGEELAYPLSAQPQRVVLPTDQLTYDIVGHAMSVHRAKGSGFRENTYQKDLETHFAKGNLRFVAQKLLDVFDSVDGRRLIGYYIPDFIVDERVVVEIKALPGLHDSHVAQLIGYLAVSGCEVGLLINFGQRSLDWKRILPPKRVQDHQVNRQWLFVPEWLQEE